MGLLFVMNVACTSQKWQTLRTLVLGAQKTEESFTHMIHTEEKQQSGVMGAPMVLYVYNTLIIKDLGEAIIIECLTLTSGQKLKDYYRTLFARWMNLVLILRVPSVLVGMKCFQIHGLNDVVEPDGQKGCLTKPH